MTVTEIRRKAKKHIDSLSSERLRSALDFLTFLDRPEKAEISRGPRARMPFDQRMKKAEEDIAAGRVTPAEKLRRKY